ncbi:MAG TPA: SH3 domain-containing protein [bacterium]|nr:SH3 domain-containing protein [bacterium]
MQTVKTPCAVFILLALTATVLAQEEEDYEFSDPLSRMTVIVDTLRIRDLPATEGSEVVGMLHLGDTVPYAEMNDDWARIKAPDGTVGWACIVLGGETFMVQDIYIFFTGTLTDAAGDPVAGAVIELVGTGTNYVTDEEGRFDDYEVPRGTWGLRVTVGERSALLENTITLEDEYYEKTLTVNLDTEYRLTITLEEAEGIAKPNIYIYPIEETEVRVRLGFPAGGGITVSDPPYGEGWTVTVTPEGIIDGERTFLFYEARSGGSVQREEGWVVPREDLEAFFRENLRATGFYEPEIEDFAEFWVPRLDDHPYFALYPQYDPIYDGMVGLDVDPDPWTVIRLAYVVVGLEEYFDLMPAAIPAYEIGGFTVHEWGVILSPGDMDAYLY